MIQGNQDYFQEAADTARRLENVAGGMMFGNVDQGFATGTAMLGLNPMQMTTMTPDAMYQSIVGAMREGLKGIAEGSPEARRMTGDLSHGAGRQCRHRVPHSQRLQGRLATIPEYLWTPASAGRQRDVQGR